MRIGRLDDKSPVVTARKTHLNQARASAVKQTESVMNVLDSTAATSSPTKKPPLAADISFNQLAADFDAALQRSQRRLAALPSPTEKKKADETLRRVLQFAGGNDAILQMIAGAEATSKAPELAKQKAMLTARGQEIRRRLEAWAAMPDSVSRDERILKLTQANAGLFGTIRWIDEQLRSLNKNLSWASFDSELSLLHWDDYSVLDWLPNPWHYSHDANPTRRQTTLMVARLAAPTPQIVRKMIDDAIATEKTYLNGTVYLDAKAVKAKPGETGRGSYHEYEQSLRDLAARVKKHTTLKVVLDDRKELFQPGACPNAALYCGWYSLANYVDAFDWAPGAVGYHSGQLRSDLAPQPESFERPKQEGLVSGDARGRGLRHAGAGPRALSPCVSVARRFLLPFVDGKTYAR